MHPKSWVLITGASSGIGAEYARQLAAKGYSLILCGRRAKQLSSVARQIKEAFKTEVRLVIADLAQDSQLAKLIKTALKAKDLVGLVNNAGFGLSQELKPGSFSDMQAMLKVHIEATTRLIHALLPQLLKAGPRGFVINVSSLAALIATPTSPLYAASKAYLCVLSESLFATYYESGLMVQALCPGFTKTDFHLRLGMRPEERKNRGLIRWMTAKRVVSASLKALHQRKVIVVPGFLNRLGVAIVRLGHLVLGSLYYRIAGSMARRIKAYPIQEEQYAKAKSLSNC